VEAGCTAEAGAYAGAYAEDRKSAAIQRKHATRCSQQRNGDNSNNGDNNSDSSNNT
jgi:hypothetical protein